MCSKLTEKNEFAQERVLARYQGEFAEERSESIDYMDVSPRQTVSVATALPKLTASAKRIRTEKKERSKAIEYRHVPFDGTSAEKFRYKEIL